MLAIINPMSKPFMEHVTTRYRAMIGSVVTGTSGKSGRRSFPVGHGFSG